MADPDAPPPSHEADHVVPHTLPHTHPVHQHIHQDPFVPVPMHERMSYIDDQPVNEKLEKSSSDPEKGGIAGHPEVTEIGHAGDRLVVNHSLHRGLKSRHIQMISIGGVIGTGLFLGTANALRHGGPLGLWLGYIVMGSFVYCVMIALGEMIAQLPLAGGHITLANRFVDGSLSFTMGWNYWYNWTIVLPAELSAAAVLVGYWNQSVNPAVWITIFLIVVCGINLGGARVYGEAEFWFAIIKVITIIGLIIAGIVITSGGGPNHQSIGFRYWRDPGPFVQYLALSGAKGRFLGFFSVLIQAAFSYIGTEIVGIAAGEARNPKKSLPRAIKRVYIRICLFYILGTFIIGLLVSPDDPQLNLNSTAAGSPWVIAIKQAGIGGLPSVINAALLTSAWSAASSDLYTSSRALFSMSINGSAPKIFAKTNRWGLPYLCFIVGVLFSLLSYMSAGDSTAGEVFGWFANMTSVAGLQTWVGILWTYTRWHKGCVAQGIDRRRFPFRAPFQPYLTWYAFFGCCIILIFNGWEVFLNGQWDAATFVTSYLPLPLFLILLFGYKFYHGTKMIAPHEMDFYTGSRDDIIEDDPPPKNAVERFWRWLM